MGVVTAVAPGASRSGTSQSANRLPASAAAPVARTSRSAGMSPRLVCTRARRPAANSTPVSSQGCSIRAPERDGGVQERVRGGDRVGRAVVFGEHDLAQPAEIHVRFQLRKLGRIDDARPLAPVPLFRHAPDELGLKRRVGVAFEGTAPPDGQVQQRLERFPALHARLVEPMVRPRLLGPGGVDPGERAAARVRRGTFTIDDRDGGPAFARWNAIDAPMMPAPATTTRGPAAARASRASAAAPSSCRNWRRSSRKVRSGSLIGLALEPVVAVAAPAAGELPEAGERHRPAGRTAPIARTGARARARARATG